MSDEAGSGWYTARRTTPGGQPFYSDLAIETSLICGTVFNQPLRQTEGLMPSLFKLLRVDLSVPDHTTLSRRCTALSVCRTGRHHAVKEGSGPVHIPIDSTGLKFMARANGLKKKWG